MINQNETHRGFTLVEILSALAVLGVVVLITGRIFLSQAEADKIRNSCLQGQRALRSALEILHRDFRGVGYPPLPPYFLNDPAEWFPESFIPKIPRPMSLQGLVSISSDPQGADMVSLILLQADQTNPTFLSEAVSAGNTRLPLALSSTQVSSQFKPADVLYLGDGAETAVVVAISGSSLIIDTDPRRPGWQGLKRDYPAGTEVGELSLVSYALFTDDNDPGGRYHEPGLPLLKRKINAGAFEPLIEGVKEMNIDPMPPSWFRLRLSVAPLPAPKRSGALITLSSQVWKK